ncbi:hypothetical protein PG985_014432 [Apiospora marii]|uniref:uncharacterized protein n=1 Tax=Apiospora marii TaxID=335849 RepID=UPI003132649E
MDSTLDHSTKNVSPYQQRRVDATTPRGLNRYSLAVDFIDNRLVANCEEFKNAPTTFDPDSGRYVPLRRKSTTETAISEKPPTTQQLTRPEVTRSLQSAPNEMSFWAFILPSAMNELQSGRPNEPRGRADSPYSIRWLKTWNEVYEVLQRARDAYEDSKGFRRGFVKGFRKVASNSQLLKGAAKLVPEFSFASPAAHRSLQVRETVTRCLDDLGNRLGDIEAYLATFPGDENIMSASVLLVTAILRAIEDVIGYYITNAGIGTGLKAFSALFNGQEYQKSLHEALDQIATSSQTLLHQASNSDMWQNRKALESTQENSIRTHRIDDRTQRMADTQNEMMSLLAEFERKLLNEKRQQYEIERLKQQNTQLHAQVNYYLARAPSPASQYTLETRICLGDIQTLLKMPDCIEDRDMSQIIKKKELVPNKDRARAELVLQMAQFREWVVSTSSCELLIHGDFQGTHYTSGLSVFCCYFLQALEGSSQWAKLAFFCGSHLGDDAYAGGCSLIRSFISQLLRQEQQFDTSQLSVHVDLDLVERGDVRELCELFRWLLCNMRGDSVMVLFAIIDGLKYYERDEYIGDMEVVLRYLLDLAQDPSLPCVFKLLLTSPSPTTVIRQVIDPMFILSMASIPRTARVANEARVTRETSDVVQGILP